MRTESNYVNIRTFGSKAGQSAINNPMSYCLNTGLTNGFLHGSSANNVEADSPACQYFLANYCSEEWDGYCEIASLRNETYVGNQLLFPGMDTQIYRPSSGQILLRNTFAMKYLVDVINGELKYEPFDPTVASSPMIAQWSQTGDGQMVFVYDVDPTKIDSCNVMNRILLTPNIANDILLSIYRKRKRDNTLHELRNTNLGNFYILNQMEI